MPMYCIDSEESRSESFVTSVCEDFSYVQVKSSDEPRLRRLTLPDRVSMYRERSYAYGIPYPRSDKHLSTALHAYSDSDGLCLFFLA